jgi:hypothetical protein
MIFHRTGLLFGKGCEFILIWRYILEKETHIFSSVDITPHKLISFPKGFAGDKIGQYLSQMSF